MNFFDHSYLKKDFLEKKNRFIICVFSAAVWSVVSTFMSKEQKGKIMMVGKKDIGKYLSDDVRANWPHMV